MIHGDVGVHGMDIDHDVGPRCGAVDQDDPARDAAGIELNTLDIEIEGLQLRMLEHALGEKVITHEAVLIHDEEAIEISAAVDHDLAIEEVEILSEFAEKDLVVALSPEDGESGPAADP